MTELSDFYYRQRILAEQTPPESKSTKAFSIGDFIIIKGGKDIWKVVDVDNHRVYCIFMDAIQPFRPWIIEKWKAE